MAIAYKCVCGSNVLESHKGICPKCGTKETVSTPTAEVDSSLKAHDRKLHQSFYARNFLCGQGVIDELMATINEDRKQLVDDYNQLVDEHNKLLKLLKKPAYK